MQSHSLADWLAYQERLHPSTIELGLERLTRVLARLDWRAPACPVITVGGTNGKGSCVALLDSILACAGYRVGTFTSPHLNRYNERIRVAGHEVSDAALVAAFERIEAARGDVSLTFFEFNTLAALLVFAASDLDVIVLEVGLGGRLDAVNAVDADVSIVTSVALDHCEWLGADVESIGREKAGIFRSQRPAIVGSRVAPVSLKAVAHDIGARVYCLGEQFDYVREGATWTWRCGDETLAGLPLPALPGAVQLDNASAALAALRALRSRLSIDRDAIERGLQSVRLAGRFQVFRRSPARGIATAPSEWIVDVAHNPAAAATLAATLAARACSGRTLAVCGMFADKDVSGVIAALRANIDTWVVAGVNGARALAPEALAEKVSGAGAAVAAIAPDVASACVSAQTLADEADRIVVFGSFHTAGPALEWLQVNGWIAA